jgi:hypothetical protein
MLHQQYVTQPSGGINYLSLFDAALQQRPFDAFDVAVAYATVSGVKELTRKCKGVAGGEWESMEKRWLVGIDYCRTEPIAIEMLANERNSTVKVHDGTAVVRRLKCTPLLPFHPKAFLFRSDTATAIVSGSGNLSRNGLTKGHEVGSVLVVRDPLNHQERAAHDVCLGVRTWFEQLWTPATAASRVLPTYSSIFESVDHLRSPVPTDDDAGDTEWLSTGSHRGALTVEQLRQLRACKHLWIEAGTLTKNRGPRRPGNQLMLSRMTRVFFGFTSTDVERDTTIGSVSICFGSHRRDDCSLRFSNNAMDVLGLPIPGEGGPVKYDDEYLHFERMSDGAFNLTLGTASQHRKWGQASSAIEGSHAMRSGRAWGVY